MKKLVHVVRGRVDHGWEVTLEASGLHRYPLLVNPQHLDLEQDDLVRQGEFFLIEETDVEAALHGFARQNPGREVRVYTLEASAQAPAAAVVVKRITKDGELPI